MKKMNLLIALLMVITFGTVNAQEYVVNSSSSILEWTGKKVTGEHQGTIKLNSGEFTVRDNKIVSGKFVINMESIVCADLQDEEYNKKLVGHLKSDDFFGTKSFPTAVFVVKRSSELSNNSYTVYGDLTIKGITHPIEFKVNQVKTNDGYKFNGTAVVDRTKYNIRYGSGKFFESLGDNMIYDDFLVGLKLTATASN